MVTGFVAFSKVPACISNALDFLRHFTQLATQHHHALNASADRNTVSQLLDHSQFSTIDYYVGRADSGAVFRALEGLRV